MTPYYEHDGVVIYHGDCRDVLPDVWFGGDLMATDPPYPNNAGHFDSSVDVARHILPLVSCLRAYVFWSQLERPPMKMPLVGHHFWFRSNTNRPNNYEAIYEFAADGIVRPCRAHSYPVVAVGLTGCKEATGHPTQKPVRLMEKLILLAKAKRIIDPFMGSGTTLAAAMRLGCSAVGIEIEERYCEMAAKRLAQGALPMEHVS